MSSWGNKLESMSWGNKIIIGLACFMIFIVGAGIYMVSKDSDSLIDEDYYENSLSYDKIYERKQNLYKEDAVPNIQLAKDTLKIQFVAMDNQGTLTFKRPSDGSLDKAIPFSTKGNEFILPMASFKRGNWNLEISWTEGGKMFQYTKSLFL